MGKDVNTPAPPPAPDPMRIAQAEAFFNRINQFTPFGNLQFYNPGQEPTGQQQVGFLQPGLTSQAAGLFPAPATSGGTPDVSGDGAGTPSNPLYGQIPPELAGNYQFSGDFGIPGFGFNGMNIPGGLTGQGLTSASSVMQLPDPLLQLSNARLTSDANFIASVLGRQGNLPTGPIDTGGLPDIISQLNLPGNLAGRLPNSQFYNLQRNPNLYGLPDLPAGVDLERNLDFGGAAALPDEFNAYRGDVESALFERERSLLEPEFQRNEERLRQSLANRGLGENSSAFGEELGRFERGRGETMSRLAQSAVLAGGQEASRALEGQLALRGVGTGEAERMASFFNQTGLAGTQLDAALRGQGFGERMQQGNFYNQALQNQFNLRTSDILNRSGLNQQDLQNQLTQAGLSNQARQSLFNELAGVRQNQFNELASMMGLQQVAPPNLGDFFAPSPVDVTGAFGLQQQALQNNYNSQLEASSNAKGSVSNLMGNLGAAGIYRYSDPRLKTNVKQVATSGRLKVYRWDWNEEAYKFGFDRQPPIGFMADEVEEMYPEAVFTDPLSGYKMIHYVTLFEALDHA